MKNTSINTCLTLQNVVCSVIRFGFICNFFEETNFCHLHAYLLACFSEKHLQFLTFHIRFRLDDSELWKQYQFVSQEMMELVCDLKTVQRQEIPIKAYVVFYDIEICFRDCGAIASFLQSFNIPKCIIVGLSMVEGLFSLIFYC